MLTGAFTALITPFKDGALDEQRLKDNVAFQIEQGIDGLVPVGTTGESPTLSHDEHRRVIELVVETAKQLSGDKSLVIAGEDMVGLRVALALLRSRRI